MFFNRFDSYYYSRPVSYVSFTRKISPTILPTDDSQTTEVLSLLNTHGITPQDKGNLYTGIFFLDMEVGKRTYNHNSFSVSDEYYIRQSKSTNDLSTWHPTGTHLVYKTFQEFMTKLSQVLQELTKK